MSPCVVRCASGVTLLELLVVLTILGVILGITGLALGSLQAPRESQEIMDLREARTAAIRSGTPRFAHGVLFLPDGRAIGATVDRLTGTPDAR
ncbi:MAG TPA: prepilin-type N-terminal cleavage/methylation domain-containing protein [Gemmatimonadales bacterium]|nr:prepilin-type N-terminal cleavage/methylation domain-containing protein [Gemmatimonadales bacterium]